MNALPGLSGIGLSLPGEFEPVALPADLAPAMEFLATCPDKTVSSNAEDLWGIWVSLQKGFLTQEKAGWAAFESGSALISLLALLPFVRLIEIQRFGDAASELALELAQPATSMAPANAQSTEQMALQWH